MRIDQEKCVGCGQCVPYCPVGAITLKTVVETGRKRKFSEIDFDECVECACCFRYAGCPEDAISREELDWPRVLRNYFSEALAYHKLTDLPGRGTEEGKTNDVTGRFKRGYVGVALEFGRPVLGARLYDVEKAAMGLAPLGVEFEPKNPATALMEDTSTGKFKGDVLNEKVMSLILEFVIEVGRLLEVFGVLKNVSQEIDSVFSLDIITRKNPDGSDPIGAIVKEAGLWLAPNGKTCVALGRPLAKEE